MYIQSKQNRIKLKRKMLSCDGLQQLNSIWLQTFAVQVLWEQCHSQACVPGKLFAWRDMSKNKELYCANKITLHVHFVQSFLFCDICTLYSHNVCCGNRKKTVKSFLCKYK